MKRKKFKGELLSGHKDHAVEVPFDPAIEWRLEGHERVLLDDIKAMQAGG